MKMTRKILALALCLIMVFGLAVTASAGAIDGVVHTHTIKISSRDGYKFVAYQIFKGDLDEKGTLSNIDWGNGVDGAALLEDLKATYPGVYGSGVNDAEDVATILAKDTKDDNDTAMQFADIAAKHVIKAKGYPETSKHSIEVKGDGYYLVVNTEVPTGENVHYSRHMLEVVRDVLVSHKGTFPTVEKKILEGETRVDINEASIGDKVSYELVGSLPNNLSDYDAYFYRFTDTLSKGLTYNNDAVILIDGYNVTDYFHKKVSEYSETTGTTIQFSVKDILALRLIEDVDPLTEGNQKLNLVGGLEGTQIIVRYSATLNKNAVVAVAGNPNVVKLEYSNNPNEDGKPSTTPPDGSEPNPDSPIGVTPEDKVETYTTKLAIQKTDGTGAPLKGAEFRLTGSGVNVVLIQGKFFRLAKTDETPTWYKLVDGTFTETAPVTADDPSTPDIDEKNDQYYANPSAPQYIMETVYAADSKGANPVDIMAFVDDNGKLVFTGLGAGDYVLSETVTPKGFNTIDDIEFKVTFNVADKKFRSDNTAINVGQDETDDTTFNSLYTTVVNHAGSTLPSTGGIGTTLFYVIGGLLFVGAAVLLVTKKRMAC